MFEKIEDILNRIGSRHLAQLWQFYRDYFSNDEMCLKFLHETLLCTPVSDGTVYHQQESDKNCFANDAGKVIYDSDFIPRRMLNAVVRLVSSARDMNRLYPGKDVYKVIFIVTCAETLQGLSGVDDKKKNMLFSFMEEYTNEDDKQFIAERFHHNDEEQISEGDSFKQFVGVLNEYRNCAAHEGEYWNYCFNNNNNDYPVLLVLNIDLEKYSRYHKKEHCFETRVSYQDFEAIFVRTCISFIRRYVAQKQEGKEHADT